MLCKEIQNIIFKILYTRELLNSTPHSYNTEREELSDNFAKVLYCYAFMKYYNKRPEWKFHTFQEWQEQGGLQALLKKDLEELEKSLYEMTIEVDNTIPKESSPDTNTYLRKCLKSTFESMKNQCKRDYKKIENAAETLWIKREEIENLDRTYGALLDKWINDFSTSMKIATQTECDLFYKTLTENLAASKALENHTNKLQKVAPLKHFIKTTSETKQALTDKITLETNNYVQKWHIALQSLRNTYGSADETQWLLSFLPKTIRKFPAFLTHPPSCLRKMKSKDIKGYLDNWKKQLEDLRAQFPHLRELTLEDLE
jgi:hypothetical protein